MHGMALGEFTSLHRAVRDVRNAFLLFLNSICHAFYLFIEYQEHVLKQGQEKTTVAEATTVAALQTIEERLVGHGHKTNDLTTMVIRLMDLVKGL